MSDATGLQRAALIGFLGGLELDKTMNSVKLSAELNMNITLSRRNVVIVALFQIIVIVNGLLAIGASKKFLDLADVRPATLAVFLTDYGVVLLLIPLVWAFIILTVISREDVSDGAKGVGFAFGLVLIGLILWLVGYAVFSTWMSADMGIG